MKAKWMAGVMALSLGLSMAIPVAGQSVAGWAGSGAGARLVLVSRRRRRHAKAKAKAKAKGGTAVSRGRMELAQEMVRDAYEQGRGLELRQRVALMMRLLYTMPPEVMAEEKRQWAEELFGLAEQLPVKPGSAGNADLQDAGLPDADLRNTAIAVAAVRVAVYDSDRALELLDTLPSGDGRREDARTMASRLVFVIYMQHHGAAGAQTLLAHARKWGEHGGFPYEASAAALDGLRKNEDAAEDFFRQEMAVFARGQEGVFGVREFAGLLDQAVAQDAISDESAEEAGRAVVAQLGKLAGSGASDGETAGGDVGKQESAAEEAAVKDTAANPAAVNGATAMPGTLKDETAAAPTAATPAPAVLTEEEKRQVMEALNDVRLAAPKAYAQAAKDWPGLLALQAVPVATPAENQSVDAGLQASFAGLAEVIKDRRGPEALHDAIAHGLQLVNARYEKGGCAKCAAAGAGAGNATLPAAGALVPDAQSWALVSLAAYASPMTIAAQLKTIRAPFWHAYFMAIAAQQVGEPARVADPTARTVPGEDEAD